MTANVEWTDVLVVVVCFFAVTKPASICNHKKFQNHENDSLQITRYFTYWSDWNIRIFSADFRQTKIRRRIRLSAAAWGLCSRETVLFPFLQTYITSQSGSISRNVCILTSARYSSFCCKSSMQSPATWISSSNCRLLSQPSWFTSVISSIYGCSDYSRAAWPARAQKNSSFIFELDLLEI